MQTPQFAERQYEAAVHVELARGQASPFVPTQNMEAYIGIDAAADPGKRHAIWRILSVQIPRRTQMSPALWPALPLKFHNEIPGRFCSLFMQFKRPIFQDDKRAKYYKQMRGPYFEVQIAPQQQVTLQQLQARVRGRAVVRYAAPAFWSRNDFDKYDQRREVLAKSAYMLPSRIGAHRKWMYLDGSRKVVLNPDPESTEGEDWTGVINEMLDSAVSQSLRDHIRVLAAAVSDETDQRREAHDNVWLTRIARYGQFSEDDNSFLVNMSRIALAAEAADSTWVVMLLPDDDWNDLFKDERIWLWYWPMWL